jgi:hypothetical protein
MMAMAATVRVGRQLRGRAVGPGLVCLLLPLLTGCIGGSVEEHGGDQGPAVRDQFIAFIIDGTGFAEKWWDPSLDTAAKLLGEVARPKNTVCVMKIDDYSYEDSNVLLGPTELPSSTLRMHQVVRDMKSEIRDLRPPDPEKMKPGTDITGCIFMLRDYLEDRPDCWLNLFIFSDLVEEQQQGKYEGTPQLPDATRVVCLFVARKRGIDYDEHKKAWAQEMAKHGVHPSHVHFLDSNQSRAGKLRPDDIRSFRLVPTEATETEVSE